MKAKPRRRSFMAMLLAVTMLLTMIPAVVFAVEDKAAFEVNEVTTLTSGKDYVIITQDTDGKYYAMSNEKTTGTDNNNRPRIGVAIEVTPTFDGTAISKLTFDASKKDNMYFTSASASSGIYLQNPARGSDQHYQMYISDMGEKGGVKYQSDSARVINYVDNQLYGVSSQNGTYYVVLAATADEYGIRFQTTKTQSEAANIIILEVTNDDAEPDQGEPANPVAQEKAAKKGEIAAIISDSTDNYYTEALNALKAIAADYTYKIDQIDDNDADGVAKVDALFNNFKDEQDKIITKNDVDYYVNFDVNHITELIDRVEFYDTQSSYLNSLITDIKNDLPKTVNKDEANEKASNAMYTAAHVPKKDTIDAQIAVLEAISTTPEFATYSKEEQQKILDLIDEYKNKIKDVTFDKDMENIVKDFQTGLDAITENSGATANAKTKASAEIDKAVSSDNLSKYKDAEQAKIKELAAKYKDAIAKATSADAANKLLSEFNAEVAKLKTAAEIDQALKTQVEQASVAVKKPKAGKKKVTVKWTANKIFDGYEVNYKIKGKGKKWKKANVSGGTKTKKVIKKLKKGKKYQVKVRGYKTVAGAKVYSKFSKTKTTKKVK